MRNTGISFSDTFLLFGIDPISVICARFDFGAESQVQERRDCRVNLSIPREQAMIHLEKVTGKNVWDILKLEVAEEQRTFVAANEVSIIEAYIAITGNGHAFPFGIYDNNTLVGFLMIGFDVDDDWEDAPQIAKGNYNLWRLMIDKNYQGHGFGKEAVRLALDFMKTQPCGEAAFCWLSYEPENEAARQLYRSFGFEETDEMDGEEVIAVMKL